MDSMKQLFDKAAGNAIRESVADKLSRHNYASVGNDILEDITSWLDECGLSYKTEPNGRIQTFIRPQNQYFVFKKDGTLIAAQKTAQGAWSFIQPGYHFHQGTPETAARYQSILRECQGLGKLKATTAHI